MFLRGLAKQPRAVFRVDKEDSSSFSSAFTSQALLERPLHLLVILSSQLPSMGHYIHILLTRLKRFRNLVQLTWLMKSREIQPHVPDS